MFCSQCNQPVSDGEHFCSNCGAPLQEPGAVTKRATTSVAGGRGRERVSSYQRSEKPQDPYKDQIQELRLQIRQLKLDLKQINNSMNRTRSRYNQTAAFLPGRIREGAKWFEDFRLLGKQPKKESLQQEIADLQQELLGLQEAQLDWKREHGRA